MKADQIYQNLKEVAEKLGILVREQNLKNPGIHVKSGLCRVKEEQLFIMDKHLSVKDKVEGIVVGGIASSYQGKRIKKICDELNLKFLAPIWDYTPDKLWKELLSEGFRVIMTKISCDGLGKEWIGRVIDGENIKELESLSKKFQFRMDFEGGEAETAVLYMPEFKEEIKLDFDVFSEGDYRHFIKINSIR